MNEMYDTSGELNQGSGLLDRPLAAFWRWDWEKVLWLGLLLLAVATRFADLGARSMSHDESEHGWFAYNLYAGKGYQHSPVYHGPFVYHVLAFFYMIFGDSTLMARVPTALFGLGVLLLCWLLRRWIGRIGALLAATLLTLSPAILHYSRHTRHDIYVIFWGLLFIIAVFRYLDSPAGQGRHRWLYVAAASLSLALATKEVAFIYGAAVGGFVVLIILQRWLQEGEAPLRLTRQDGLVLAGVLLLSLLGALLFRLLGVTTGATGRIIASLVVMLLPPLGAVGLALWHVNRRAAAPADPGSLPEASPLVFSSAADVALILATLILPWLSPLLIAALGYDPLDYGFPVGILRSLSVVLGFAGLAIALGALWNVRRWLAAAGLFYVLFLLFFTTFFTNGQGFATGLVGSLGYWLSQQEVARGGQPWYYYLLIVPLYEFLPIVLSVPVLLATLLRRRRGVLAMLVLALILLIAWVFVQISLPQAGAESGLATLTRLLVGGVLVLILLAVGWGGLDAHSQPRRYFLAFLPFWILINWFAYTVAGEKMPWLTTHITLPMCIAGGWWLGQVLERVDWTAVRQRGGWSIPILIAPLLAALVALVSSQPFRSRTLSGLGETSQWLAALIIGAVLLVLLVRQARRLGLGQAGRMVGLTAVLLLALWTVRTSYMLNYINYDNVSEFLFYAHASPDPQLVMEQVEDISRRTAGDKQLRVAYDDDASWPFNWYLRDWPNGVYFGASPTRDVLLDSPVAIVGNKNLDKARPYLQRDYYEFSHRLIWWPQEGYKDLSLAKIRQGIGDPVKRKEFLDVLIWRRYPTPLAEWPLVHRFSFFVRKDLAAQLWDYGAQPASAAEIVDPYDEGFQELVSLFQVGEGQGSAPGQLSFPRNVAVGGDGTVYVADSGNHRIQVFDPRGVFLRQWGGFCELYTDVRSGCLDPDGDGPLQVGDGQLQEPWGVAIGPQGNVYVADTWNHRIQVFDAQGQFLNKWGTFVTTEGRAEGSPGGFWGPRAIAIDGAGNLYVTDTGNKRIQVFDAQGQFLAQFGGGGVVEGRFDEPVGLNIIPAGQDEPGGALFVADAWNQRVQVFEVSFQDGSPLFEFAREWPIRGWESQSVVNKPYLAVALPFDASDEAVPVSALRAYVSDPENRRILVFDGQGEFKAAFGLYGSDAQSFGLPNGVAIGRDGNLYVADADNHRIMVFPGVP